MITSCIPVKWLAIALICDLLSIIRSRIGAPMLVAMSLALMLDSSGAMAAVHGTTSWAVLRCQLKNTPKPTFESMYAKDPEQFYSDFFTKAGEGKGGLYDYWGQISDGNISLKGSKVFPWVNLNVTYNGDPKRDRGHQVQDCIDATEKYLAHKHLTGKQYDLSHYYGLFILQNRPGGEFGSIQSVQINGKSYSKGVVFFEFGSLDLSHAAHEMGHGYGLDHAFDDAQKGGCGGGGPGEYCDPWDPMGNPFWTVVTWFTNPSFGTATCCGPAAQSSEQSSAGPGLNVPNLLHLGWIPSGRIATYTIGDPATSFTLNALSHPNSSGVLAVHIPAIFFTVTVEYRQQDGWDAGIPANVVLLHTYEPSASPYSFLMDQELSSPFPGALLPGQTLTEPDYSITVNGVDPGSGTASVTIGPGSGG